jgi:hypothetical protein
LANNDNDLFEDDNPLSPKADPQSEENQEWDSPIEDETPGMIILFTSLISSSY